MTNVTGNKPLWSGVNKSVFVKSLIWITLLVNTDPDIMFCPKRAKHYTNKSKPNKTVRLFLIEMDVSFKLKKPSTLLCSKKIVWKSF